MVVHIVLDIFPCYFWSQYFFRLFAFLVPAHPGSPGKRAVKWVYVCVCLYSLKLFYVILSQNSLHRFSTGTNSVQIFLGVIFYF